MLEFSRYSLVTAVVLVGLALVGQLAACLTRGAARTPVMAGSGGGTGASGAPGGRTVTGVPDPATGAPHGMAWYAAGLAQLSLLFLTVSLVARTVHTGHGPFGNQFEFAVSFAWGMLAAHVYFDRRYRVRMLALVVLPISLAMLLYALSVGSEAVPLVPALQNNLLLTLHVIMAVVAYGSAAVACAAGALYLVQPDGGRRRMPKPRTLDEIGYRAVVVSFPSMTLMIVLGAVWADIAWGSYWSWDPKETASLATWLIYGAYLHARVVRGWRGRRSAVLLMVGFAAILLTYFGNLFFGGLHGYA